MCRLSENANKKWRLIKTVRYVIVRKEHVCGDCNKPIHKGEEVMKYDDNTKVVHTDCYWKDKGY